MSTRAFWKLQAGSRGDSGSNRSGNAETPSTSGADAQDATAFDMGGSSSRLTSEEKSALLTASTIESATLWKQPSKKRLFGMSSAVQKRYFVLTSNELAYKEKDNGNNEFKVVWKLANEVVRIEPPAADAKEFSVIVSENGALRTVKLQAADPLAAAKFASSVDAAIKAASIVKPVQASAVDTSINSVGATELTLEDAHETSEILTEAPSVIATIPEEEIPEAITETVVVEDRTSEAEDDAVIPKKLAQESKPVVWSFWSLCCSVD